MRPIRRSMDCLLRIFATRQRQHAPGRHLPATRPDAPQHSDETGGPVDKGHFDEPNPTSFTVKPGLMCPASAYDFFKHEQLLERPIFAIARGMANAKFSWTVADVPAPVHGTWTQLTVNIPLKIKNPDGTVSTIANTTTFLYGIIDVWNESVLY